MSESRSVTVTAHEGSALEQVRQSMQLRYPGIPAAAIAERMRRAYQRYDGAPIRDFVPLLVERELTLELRTATAADPRSQR